MGLLDIAPPEIIVKHYEIRGGTLDVQGIKTKDWAKLLYRFPQLRGGTPDKPLDEGVVLTAIEGLVPAVIAAGMQACGDDETEQLIVERLSDSEQITIFSDIMRMTAPQEVVEKSPLLISPEKPKAGPLPNGNIRDTTKNSQQLSML